MRSADFDVNTGEIVPADRPGTTIMVVREPAGVVFSISPWNVRTSDIQYLRFYLM